MLESNKKIPNNSVQHSDEAVAEVKTLYWIHEYDKGYSAVMATFTPKSVEFIHYNSLHPQGIEVDDPLFYKIATGMNFDYDCVNAEDFNSFILKKCK